MRDKKVKILLIEDDAAHVELIRWAFEFRAGWAQLTIASNLQQAHLHLRETTPDLILTDLFLPDGKGTELLPVEPTLLPYPIVIMTGHGDEQIAVEAMKLGAMDYVVKSEATLAAIPHVVERALHGWDNIIKRHEAEKALKDSRQTMQNFLLALKALHKVGLTLAVTDSFEELCRRAVELGQTELGFDRLGIWLLDEDPQFRIGTYGVDENGLITDERHLRLPNEVHFAEDLPASANQLVEDDVPLIFQEKADLRNGPGEVKGCGWLAVAALWNGDQIIGWLAVDNLLQQQPLLKYQLEIIKLYSASLAHLMTRKLVEEQIRASLQEKELLLKEIHHRVKNNLQVVSSLLDLQSNYVQFAEARNFLRESQTRIRSMSLVHERLYQTNNLARVDFQLYIRDLVANLLRVYGSPPGVEIKTAIDKVALDLDTAIPCGLIINELVSNTLKYAFPDDRSGTIFIGLQPGNADQVKLTVQDNGIGLPDGVDLQKADSLGLRLVYLLTNQLGGHCTIDNSQGASFQISFDIR